MNASVVQEAGGSSVEFDRLLFRKLDQSGPSYGSYPTADRFSVTFRYRDYLQAVAGLRTRGAARPLSLYLHIPVREPACYYCARNKITANNRARSVTYVGYLKREIEMQGRLFAGMNLVEQLYLGGGTPACLSDEQIGDLMAHVRRWFQLTPDAQGEYAVGIDPRTVSPERVLSLRRHGFNRLNLGEQGCGREAQRAGTRAVPGEDSRIIIDAARSAGYRSVSVDLVYGLPEQNVIGMAQALARLLAAGPDRIAIHNYAHLPHLSRQQRRMADAGMPGPDARLDMLALCIRRLAAAGYVHIGMDHFARPGDELAVAQQQGRLHRNLHGYSAHAEADLVACGVSAVGSVGATYSQNARTLDAYYDALDRNELPVVRGARLSMDDALRRTVIQALVCSSELSMRAIEQAYPIEFASYFGAELERLKLLADLGLLTAGPDWLTVTPKGRLLIRNICMVFDRYLGSGPPAARASRPD